MTSRISSAYDAVREITGAEYLEPLSHVQEVGELRQQFRPKQVKLLVIAESHVRGLSKPGFIYDRAYYTPWWPKLLRPAFGDDITREGLQDRGVWILDMSIIALSGYRKLYPESPNRPFDSLANQIFTTSWLHCVQRDFEQAACSNVVYFLLPASLQLSGTPLKFCARSNASRYKNPDYRFGTARFIEAVRAAGL